ncbi:hypothetical protein TRSC58_02735 [Trypanosoma rangeli SC58]|uniref:F-box domain-containing protein n=1 Tax=Trypanosoma rangeli SC58 TaxID=429131 RepID=A0A061J8D0_TRYRA|nr:hypothetical protein TRSC58_02735 [Trypanosoma rangeli SC58]
MPHLFSRSSVSFLERFQFLQRCRHGERARRSRVPTDALSLMDVLLHTNSIFTIFSRLKHSLDAAQTSGGSQEQVAGDNLAHATSHLQEDMSDFDSGLSEEVLGPLLLSFLSFYLDYSIGMATIRRALCALFETTPYLHEVDEDAEVNSPLRSNIALLLLSLSRALLCSQAEGEIALKTSTREVGRRPVLPFLPWLRSRAEHATQKPTWYWWASQDPRTLCRLTSVVSVCRSTSCEAAADVDAISVSYGARRATRKRGREAYDDAAEAEAGKHRWTSFESQAYRSGPEFSAGIIFLPYDVQEMFLAYLSPRALSAAVSVCKAWRLLIERRSPTLGLYLLSGRAVTRVFLQFFEDDWGKAWVRVDELTTFQRIGLQRTYLRFAQERLQRRRASAVSLGDFAVRLHGDCGTASSLWQLLEGLWNAIEVEMKLLPFLALREVRFPSLLHDGVPLCCCRTISRGGALVQMRQVLASLRGSDHPCLSLVEELLGEWSVLRGVAHAPPAALP